MKIGKTLVFLLLLMAAFTLGKKWNELLYQEICADLGGKRHPGEYPICVITETVTEDESGTPAR